VILKVGYGGDSFCWLLGVMGSLLCWGFVCVVVVRSVGVFCLGRGFFCFKLGLLGCVFECLVFLVGIVCFFVISCLVCFVFGFWDFDVVWWGGGVCFLGWVLLFVVLGFFFFVFCVCVGWFFVFGGGLLFFFLLLLVC